MWTDMNWTMFLFIWSAVDVVIISNVQILPINMHNGLDFQALWLSCVLLCNVYNKNIFEKLLLNWKCKGYVPVILLVVKCIGSGADCKQCN